MPSQSNSPLHLAGRSVSHLPDGSAEIPYLLYVPDEPRPEAPLLVAIHGISRNDEEHFGLFTPYAHRYGAALVVPRFERATHPGYQRLVSRSGERADLALVSVLLEVFDRLGRKPAPVSLFGFSGGAQFAHRFALVHPTWVERMALCAAGFYTFPDETVPYPMGLGPRRRFRDLDWRLHEWLRIPTAVLVGDRDTERDEALRQSPELDRIQGRNRVDRARRFTLAMNVFASRRGLRPPASLHLLRGCGHDFDSCMFDGRLGDLVAAALYENEHS